MDHQEMSRNAVKSNLLWTGNPLNQLVKGICQMAEGLETLKPNQSQQQGQFGGTIETHRFPHGTQNGMHLCWSWCTYLGLYGKHAIWRFPHLETSPYPIYQGVVMADVA